MRTAQEISSGEHHGLACAYAISGRTADDADLARTEAQHAVTLARRTSTDIALGCSEGISNTRYGARITGSISILAGGNHIDPIQVDEPSDAGHHCRPVLVEPRLVSG